VCVRVSSVIGHHHHHHHIILSVCVCLVNSRSCEVLIDVGICQYRCGALGEGIPGDTNGFTGELLLDGNYTAGRVVTNAEIYKANNDTDVDEMDVGAPPPVEAKAEDKVEAQSTSGGSSAGVASYLLLAAVGAGATMIVGL